VAVMSGHTPWQQMKTEIIRDRLVAYREAREHLHSLVVAAHHQKIPQTEIARLSGMSRDGVRKIILRHRMEGEEDHD